MRLSEEVFTRNGQPISSISCGMSDDDSKNVAALETLVIGHLADAYPQVKFVVFDTSGGRSCRTLIDHRQEKEHPQLIRQRSETLLDQRSDHRQEKEHPQLIRQRNEILSDQRR